MAAGITSPLEITFLGHAAVRLRGSRIVYIDPFLTGNPRASMTADKVTAVDVIGVTHDHDDHLGDAFDISNRTGATIVAIHELAVEAQARGLSAVGMNIGGTVEVKGVRVHMVPALHSAARGHSAGLIFDIDGKRIYHAGDTGLTADMKIIGEYFPARPGLPADRRLLHHGTRLGFPRRRIRPGEEGRPDPLRDLPRHQLGSPGIQAARGGDRRSPHPQAGRHHRAMAYLIDGNNLLGCLFPGWHRDPENKLKLVRRLIAFHRTKRSRVILVFDGAPVPDPDEMALPDERFSILHPERGGSADAIISEFLDRGGDKRHLTSSAPTGGSGRPPVWPGRAR